MLFGVLPDSNKKECNAYLELISKRWTCRKRCPAVIACHYSRHRSSHRARIFRHIERRGYQFKIKQCSVNYNTLCTPGSVNGCGNSHALSLHTLIKHTMAHLPHHNYHCILFYSLHSILQETERQVVSLSKWLF